MIEEGPGVELVDGAILTDPPQGAAHFVVFMALEGRFAEARLVAKGLVVGPTVVLSDHDVFDPEFALLRPKYVRNDLPRAADVLWVVEVSVSSRHIDLGPKKLAYARAGVPHYWVVDAEKRGAWSFSEPANGEYRATRFVPADESIPVPILGTILDLATVFPPRTEPS